MDIRLFSIDQLPRSIPIWETIIEDLGKPPPERIARALGVGRSTVYRWNATRQAPRCAALALFWLTRWGRSAVHTQATNDAMMAVQLARSLSEERQKLREQLHQVEQANLALRLGAATRQAPALALHGSAATADHSHTDTAAEDRPTAPATLALSWPALAAPLPELPPLTPPGPAVDRPSNPAAPPPTAHSATDPGPAHTHQPQPSALQAVEVSSPSIDSVMSEWRHSGIGNGGAGHLLELRQAQQAKPQQPNSRVPLRAGVGATAPAAPHASGRIAPAACAALRGQSHPRPGTPASASVASLPFHGATAPYPAWSVPGAPPGQPVFAALSRACMTLTNSARSTK